jgi:large subunit ribosomal protein L10
MNRQQKAEFVEEIRGALDAAPMVILTDFKGITVAEIDKVRRACEAEGVQFRVVKNTLARLAVQGTSKEKLAEHFKGNIAVMFSNEDAIATAKLFRQQVKENDKLQVRAGFFEGDLLDAKGVNFVADLPSKEELLSTLLRTVQEGPRQILGVIQGPARDLLYLLGNYANDLENPS